MFVNRAAFGLLLAVIACGDDRPANILILVADDLGVDAVGAFREGTDPPPTPNIDALAARGVLFRNAWANPVCSPTRAGIMTGRYSLRTGVGTASGPESPGIRLVEMTIPEAFDAARSGYAHAAIGKWHLGSHGIPNPRLAGWAYYAGGPSSMVGNYYEWPRVVNGEKSLSKTYTTTQLVDDALDWIDRQEGPWLCYLAFYAPHGPWMAPPADLHSQDLSAAGSKLYSPMYFKAMVEAMDTEIGRLFRGLGSRLAHTNVIFIGDNGTPGMVSEAPFLPNHGKGTPYEGGVNVPLIVAGPAVVSPGREEGALVAAVDLFGTALQLGGIDVAGVLPPQVPLDSMSLVPYLRDPNQGPLRSTVFAERFENLKWRELNVSGFAAIRNRRYKLIRFFGEPRDELFDLEADPWEQHDLLRESAAADATRPTTAVTVEQRRNYRALSAEIDLLRNSGPFPAELPAVRPGEPEDAPPDSP